MINPRLFTDHAYYLPKKMKVDKNLCIFIMLDINTNMVYQITLEDLKGLLK